MNAAHAWFDPAMLLGARAGGFTLETVLGSGGFGAVYLTTGSKSESLAVKVLYPPRSRDTADLADWNTRASHFLREVQVAAQFNHPNIARIHSSGSLFWHYDDPAKGSGGSDRTGDYTLPYYVTDYLPDGVDQRLRTATFSPQDATRIGQEVCEALQVLHGADPRILHLDLNPGNIRLDKGGRAVIADFGQVLVEGVPRGDVTKEVAAIPPFVAAPEQRAGESLDVRTDIYQVGALLFLMLTGKTRQEVGVLSLLERKDVPQSLAKVIEQCTRHDKGKRFQDVTSVRAALGSAKASPLEKCLLIPAYRIGVFLSKAPRPMKRWWFWLPAGAVAGGLVAWAVWLPQPITITIANSSVKREFMAQAVADFNRESKANRDLQISSKFIRRGRPIRVEILKERLPSGVVDDYRSGTMVSDTLTNRINPTIISPAERSWLQELIGGWRGSRAEGLWSSKLGRDLSELTISRTQAVDLLRTPLVIAMWESRARAMGCWPSSGPDCTWDRLRRIAASPAGWGIVGHADWGKLKYGYGYVGRSNSATFTAILTCFSGLQKTTELKLDEVRRDTDCGRAMLDLEKADVLVLEKSEEAFQSMLTNKPGHLDAVTIYEKEVVEEVCDRLPTLPELVVAVYPQDGTIVATHPLAVLDGAPWVTSEQIKAANVFLPFLLSSQQQGRLSAYGFRSLSPGALVGPPITQQCGANPQATWHLIEVPSGQVIRAVVDLWEGIRRPSQLP